MEKKLFEGIVTPMVTPFKDRNTIDESALKLLINRLVDGGVNGIFLMGTTGEGASMTPRLKREYIDLGVKYAAGRVPVFVHIADCSLTESIELAKYAASAGAQYVVAALPFYLSLTQAEIVNYYTTLADNVPLPLFLYNIPAQTKMMISVDSVVKLCKHPNIIGMKDSSGNGTYFNTLLACVKPLKPNFCIMVGPDEMLASTMSMGSNGGVNSGSNVFPRLYVELFKACKSGDKERILQLQALVMRVSVDIYSVDKSPVSFLKGLKTALSSLGVIDNRYAEPLLPVSDADYNRIAANTKEIAALIDKIV